MSNFEGWTRSLAENWMYKLFWLVATMFVLSLIMPIVFFGLPGLTGFLISDYYLWKKGKS